MKKENSGRKSSRQISTIMEDSQLSFYFTAQHHKRTKLSKAIKQQKQTLMNCQKGRHTKCKRIAQNLNDKETLIKLILLKG